MDDKNFAESIQRAAYLLNASKVLAEEQVDYFGAPSPSVFYDGAPCDGSCLAEDIGHAVDHLCDVFPNLREWLDAHPVRIATPADGD
jgi:hypothetical protein